MSFSRLLALPLFLIAVIFAVANRRDALVSFDPFSEASPLIAFHVPLWLIVFAVFVAGFALGGLTSWSHRLSRGVSRTFERRAAARAERLKVRLLEDDPLAGLPHIQHRKASPTKSSAGWLTKLRGRLFGKRAAH